MNPGSRVLVHLPPPLHLLSPASSPGTQILELETLGSHMKKAFVPWVETLGVTHEEGICPFCGEAINLYFNLKFVLLEKS
jgi:hypothetical protein